MDHTPLRLTAKGRKENKGTTNQKLARRHSKEGENDLEQESIKQKTMVGIGGGLRP